MGDCNGPAQIKGNGRKEKPLNESQDPDSSVKIEGGEKYRF
jgi:hypothetical protein